MINYCLFGDNGYMHINTCLYICYRCEMFVSIAVMKDVFS